MKRRDDGHDDDVETRGSHNITLDSQSIAVSVGEHGADRTISSWTVFYWYALPILICFVIFGNHYGRDSVGALEKQLENDLPMSDMQYANLNSLYFFPNIVTPLLGGLVVSYIGPCRVFFLTTIISSCGYLLFAAGIELHSLWMLYCGRLIAGIVYEVTDSIPVMIVGTLYQKEYGRLVGIVNCFLRMGSVLNFILSPWSYNTFHSLSVPFWLALFVVCTGIIASYYTMRLEPVVKNYVNRESPLLPGSHNHDFDSNSSVHNNQRDSSTSMVVDVISRVFPFHRFSNQFILYMVGGACLYGSMVPFWFFGSKFLQNYYGMSVQVADMLVLLPEGGMVIISIPIGYLVDKYQPTVTQSLRLLTGSISMLVFAYVVLIYGYDRIPLNSVDFHFNITVHPVFPLIVLGVGYGLSNCIFYTLFILLLDPSLIASGSCLNSSTINIFPSIVPPLAVYLFRTDDNSRSSDSALIRLFSTVGIVEGGQRYLLFLAIMAFSGALSFFLASYLRNYSETEDDLATTLHYPVVVANAEDVNVELIDQVNFPKRKQRRKAKYSRVGTADDSDEELQFCDSDGEGS